MLCIDASAGTAKGSARSVDACNLHQAIEACSEQLTKFGGHAMAAGLTIAEAHLGEFRAVVAAQMARLYPDADFSGAIVTDGPLPGEALNLEFARSLREAGPWGAAFPEPMWRGDFTIMEQRVVGENHLKLRVRPAAGGPAVNAIAFNQAGPAYRGTIQLAFRLDVNEYRGVESPQLVVEQVAAT
mgnify:CR=1 FL=1